MITAYNGPPGAGKSHALVKDVLLRAVFAGRRVLTNIDGVNPDAVLAYCLERPKQWQVERADQLGPVVLFHGEDAQKPGFWPTEETEAQGVSTFVRPGDLVVFDEWAMFWPTGDRSEAAVQLELFMRWHRHLTHPETGVACDLAIATQSISDFSRRHRPLISRNYLFHKLDAVGMAGKYTWKAFDGKQQRKHFQTGHAAYDPDVFPLYASSSAAGAGNHTELKTNKKGTIWGGWEAKAMLASLPVLAIFSVWAASKAYAGFGGGEVAENAVAVAGGPPSPSGGPIAGPPVATAPPVSQWRIVGSVESDFGTRVIVADAKGAIRMLQPGEFDFDNGRPVSGRVDGERAIASDQLPTTPSMGDSLLSAGFGQ